MPSHATLREAARLLVFPFLLLTALTLAACTSGSRWISDYGTTNNSFSMRTGDEAVVARAGTQRGDLEVAVYRDGKVLGASALSHRQRRQLEQVFDGVTSYVDHARLQEWQDQASKLHDLAGQPDITAEDLANAADGLPFSQALSTCWSAFLRNEPARAMAALDLADDLQLDDISLRKTIRLALRGEDPGEERLASWLNTRKVRDDRKSFQLLAESKFVGPSTARLILKRLDDLYGNDRPRVFGNVASKLVADDQQARLLVASLDELYGSDRSNAAMTLLQQPDSSTEFACELIRNLDEFYGNDRMRIFLTAAHRAVTNSQGAELLVDKLEELYGSDRSAAARHLLGLKQAPTSVASGCLRQIDDFYGSDRVELLETIIASRHFAATEVQKACLRAARSELNRRQKRRVLDLMNESANLDPTVRVAIARARKAD